MVGSLVYFIALYTSSKGLSEVDSTIDLPLSIIELEIIFMDVVCRAGGGFDNGKTPMSEESLRRPTSIFLYCGVVIRGTLFASLEIVLGVMKSN